jgi:glucan phosphoethanolaminetransferase (alkaline phosphatase superfamily)
MRILSRPVNLFLLATYALLSAVPYFPLLLGSRLDRPWQMLGVEAVAWLAAWAILGKPSRLHFLLIPAFLALPTEIYLFVYYGQGISTHHLGILAETSPREALEFLGEKVWLMAAVMLSMVAWWALSWRAACKTQDLDWHDGSRKVTLAILVLLLALWYYGKEAGIRAPASASSTAASTAKAKAGLPQGVHLAAQAKGASSAASPAGSASGPSLPPLPHWAALPVDLSAFGNSWPFGLVARGMDFYKERVYLAELGERSRSFNFHAHLAGGDGAAAATPQVVVMVIGESSRFDRWSLNGYGRDTNPLLAQQSNLVTLPDLITGVSATRLSVPVIISRKPTRQSLKDGFFEKSFLSAYKDAGYKTFWLSNQISFGKFDTPVSVFAHEADVVEYLNLGGFNTASNFDQILLGPLSNVMADPAPRKLIVLHSLGSHWNYSQRYPKAFDKWQPSLFGVNKPDYTDLAIKPELNNSYDSSILYTDWFLSQVIGTLKTSGLSASMLYVADHGQTLYDGSCRIAFHGHNTQYEFHVPALVWYSDEYQQQYPDKVRQLLLHRKARLSTENIFHTLLDLGDIRYGDERLDWSFVNPAFREHKRYVDSYGWTDYDDATIKGDCHEVIANTKPLKR